MMHQPFFVSNQVTHRLANATICSRSACSGIRIQPSKAGLTGLRYTPFRDEASHKTGWGDVKGGITAHRAIRGHLDLGNLTCRVAPLNMRDLGPAAAAPKLKTNK